VPRAIVITADEEDPVPEWTRSLSRATHTVVDLELLPGDPLDYAQALQRSHLLAT
jgi:hypothetical protein